MEMGLRTVQLQEDVCSLAYHGTAYYQSEVLA